MDEHVHERVVRLRDGREVSLRPIRASDEVELRAGFERLSRWSRYLRFHGTLNQLPDEAWYALTHPDGVVRCAVVALETAAAGGQHALGVAHFTRLPGAPERAEVALTVADDAQGLGLGPELLRMLAQLAVERGIERLVALVLRENRAARRMFERLGATIAPGAHAQITYEMPAAALAAGGLGLAA